MVNIRTAHTHFTKLAVTAVLAFGLTGVSQAQEADAEVAAYAALLKKIEDLNLSIAHKEATVATQEQQISNLQGQIDRVDDLKASVEPLVAKMVNSYDLELKKDAPFNVSERFARLSELQSMLKDETAKDAVKLRKAITMYEAEMNYGLTVEQYPGNNPDENIAGWRLKACQESLLSDRCLVTNEMKKTIKERTNKELEELDASDEGDAANMASLVTKFARDRDLFDGNYLRVGRLALIYADVDGGAVYRFNPQSEDPANAWDLVEGSRSIDLYRAVKMAKGEAAVDVVEIPVVIDN